MKRIFAKKISLFLLIFPALCFSQEPKNYKGELLPCCIPRHTFTGYYLGGNVGWKWLSYKTTIETDPFILDGATFPEEEIIFNTNQGAFTPGIQAGYNYQLNSFLIGIEGDWDAGRISNGITVPVTSTATVLVPGDSFSTKSRWQYSVRARLGYVLNRLLVYGTFGFTQLNLEVTASTIPPEATDSAIVEDSVSKRLNGGTVGIGAEYALTKYWSFGVEYRYSKYYGRNFTFDDIIAGDTVPTGLDANVQNTHSNLILAKANLRVFA